MLRAAQGFEEEMVLSGAIDYIAYLEKENREFAQQTALLHEMAKPFRSSSE